MFGFLRACVQSERQRREQHNPANELGWMSHRFPPRFDFSRSSHRVCRIVN
jgi:hypothetical protein